MSICSKKELPLLASPLRWRPRNLCRRCRPRGGIQLAVGWGSWNKRQLAGRSWGQAYSSWLARRKPEK